MNTLTPQQAAAKAGVGRTTIVRALSSGELRGIRDNRNRWKIDADELSTWLSTRTDRSESGQSPSVTRMDTELADARQEIERLAGDVRERDARIEGLTVRLEDVQADRDHWRRLASRSWIDRLLGR